MPPKSIPVLITCEQCGGQQSVRPSWAGRRFCSPVCAGIARRGKYTGENSPKYAGRVSLTCPICSKAFLVKPGDVWKRRTCSLPCLAASKANAIEEYRADPDTGCWIWQRFTDKNGYARVSINGRKTLAHRAYYERFNGPIGEGLEIDHTCNNESCVNPAHLVARTPQGHADRHHFDRLSREDIAEMRRLYPGMTQFAIAKRFNVDASTVSRIVRFENWADVA